MSGIARATVCWPRCWRPTASPPIPARSSTSRAFCRCSTGQGNFDADAITRGWGDPWDIVQPGVGIKQYPCCGSTHPAVDAMLMLVRAHDLTPAMVERVDSWTHPRRLAHTNRPAPNSDLDAKFSVQYCLARALTNRAVKLEHFIGDSFRDPDDPGAAAAHPRRAASRDAHGQQRRTFRCRGAGHVDRRPRVGAASPAGDRARLANPLPAELLEAKFLDCASRVLPEAKAQRLLTLLRGLEEVDDLSLDVGDRLAAG